MDGRASTAPARNRSAVGTVMATITDRPETPKIDMQNCVWPIRDQVKPRDKTACNRIIAVVVLSFKLSKSSELFAKK